MQEVDAVEIVKLFVGHGIQVRAGETKTVELVRRRDGGRCSVVVFHLIVWVFLHCQSDPLSPPPSLRRSLLRMRTTGSTQIRKSCRGEADSSSSPPSLSPIPPSPASSSSPPPPPRRSNGQADAAAAAAAVVAAKKGAPGEHHLRHHQGDHGGAEGADCSLGEGPPRTGHIAHYRREGSGESGGSGSGGCNGIARFVTRHL